MHRHAFACIVFIVSSPSSSLDTETDVVDAPVNYVVDDPSLPEQPGKPALDQPDIAYSSLYCLH